MNSGKPRIIVTRKVPDKVADVLMKHFDVQLNQNDKLFTQDDLIKALEQSDGLLPTVSDMITSDILKKAKLKTSIIANYGVGFSNIDLPTAKNLNLVVTNTPDVLTDSTADLALFLILAASRNAYSNEAMLRSKEWRGFSLTENLGTSLQGKTLGIVGMGRVGQATAQRAISALNMKVIFFDNFEVKNLSFNAIQIPHLDDLVRASDVISIHAPGGNDGPIITKKQIDQMKKTSYLVNTARGDVIDQKALVDALVNGRILGAGLDVFEKEPNVPEELLSLSNVTLLPHIGSATVETRDAMGFRAVDNLIAHFTDKKYPSRVI